MTLGREIKEMYCKQQKRKRKRKIGGQLVVLLYEACLNMNNASKPMWKMYHSLLFSLVNFYTGCCSVNLKKKPFRGFGFESNIFLLSFISEFKDRYLCKILNIANALKRDRGWKSFACKLTNRKTISGSPVLRKLQPKLVALFRI